MYAGLRKRAAISIPPALAVFQPTSVPLDLFLLPRSRPALFSLLTLFIISQLLF